MSEGAPLRALLWGLVTAATLLVWPWLLAWVRERRFRLPADAGVPALADLAAGRTGADRPGAPTLLTWTALAVVAAQLPLGNGSLAASLDAGLLWVIMIAVAVSVRMVGAALQTATAVVGGLMTILLCVAPLVMHSASLNLVDLVLAQQGGAGNWFLVRDPFLLVAGAVCLSAMAALWPVPAPVSPGSQGLLSVSIRLGLPLVSAHLFTVVFLGGWWAAIPVFDGAPWLNTVLKNLAVLALLVWMRQRWPAWSDKRNLIWRLPLAALVACLGAVAWLVLSGAVL